MIWWNRTSGMDDDAGNGDGEKARQWAADASKGVKKRVKKEQAQKGLWPGPRISETDNIKPKKKKGLW